MTSDRSSVSLCRYGSASAACGLGRFRCGRSASLPFLPGLAGLGIFYVRDLSQTFWGRYLWLRRAWLSGEWPLWDPYVGGGNPPTPTPEPDLPLPSVLVRVIGGEVLGFNLWVAMPFPLAALGAFAFFRGAIPAAASALGAIAFALCGPIVSTGNFPNLSWSVAALPWVLWATDAVVSAPSPRRIGDAGHRGRVTGVRRRAGHAVRDAPPGAGLRAGRRCTERGSCAAPVCVTPRRSSPALGSAWRWRPSS